jgi:hypothetical protein
MNRVIRETSKVLSSLRMTGFPSTPRSPDEGRMVSVAVWAKRRAGMKENITRAAPQHILFNMI